MAYATDIFLKLDEISIDINKVLKEKDRNSMDTDISEKLNNLELNETEYKRNFIEKKKMYEKEHEEIKKAYEKEISTDFSFNSWYTSFDSTQNKKAEVFEEFKISHNLYIDGVSNCDKSFIIKKINDHTNIKTCEINKLYDFDENNKKFEVNLKDNHVFNFETSKYSLQILQIFHNIFNIRRKNNETETKYEREIIYCKTPLHVLFNEFISYLYFTSIDKCSDILNVENTKKIIRDYLNLFIIGKNSTEDIKRNTQNLNFKLINTKIMNSFLTVFIVPNFSHVLDILCKMYREQSEEPHNESYIQFQILFYSVLEEFKFPNFHFIHIPNNIKMYSTIYYSHIIAKILTIFRNVFNHKYQYFEVTNI